MTFEEEREAILAATGGIGASEYCKSYRQRQKAAGLCISCFRPRATGVCPICEKPHVAGVFCLRHKLQRISQELHRYAGLRNI